MSSSLCQIYEDLDKQYKEEDKYNRKVEIARKIYNDWKKYCEENNIKIIKNIKIFDIIELLN